MSSITSQPSTNPLQGRPFAGDSAKAKGSVQSDSASALAFDPKGMQADLDALLQRAGLARGTDGVLAVRDVNATQEAKAADSARATLGIEASKLPPVSAPKIEITQEMRRGAESFAANLDKGLNPLLLRGAAASGTSNLMGADGNPKVGTDAVGQISPDQMRQLAEMSTDMLLALFLKLNINDPNNAVETHNMLSEVATNLRQQAIDESQQKAKTAAAQMKEAQAYAQQAQLISDVITIVMIVVAICTAGAALPLLLGAMAVMGAMSAANGGSFLEGASLAASVVSLGATAAAQMAAKAAAETAKEAGKAAAKEMAGVAKEAAQKAVQEAIAQGKDLTKKAVQDEIKQKVQDAVQAAMKDSLKASVQEATKQATETAVKESSEVALKELGTDGMQQAVQEGMNEAISEATQSAVTEALKNGGTKLSEDTIQEIAKSAADGAVAGAKSTVDAGAKTAAESVKSSLDQTGSLMSRDTGNAVNRGVSAGGTAAKGYAEYKSQEKLLAAEQTGLDAKRFQQMAEMMQAQIEEEGAITKMIMESKNAVVDAVMKMMQAMFATQSKVMSAGMSR